jgi:nucleoside-diphosphate-sugar epimerase
MRIFVTGASGAIGQPLIAELIRQGHTVTAMSRSAAGAQKLVDLRASVAVVNAFDQLAVEQALRRAQAEVVIDQLTALLKDPSQIATAFPGDRKLRLEGGGNLNRAAQAAGVALYIQQASGFFLKAGRGLADESTPLATDASPGVAALTVPPGIYNVVDDDPSPVSRWLPAFAQWLGAPPPPQISEQQAREAAGEDAVYYGTKLSGASNEKAKRTFGFRPRRLQWLDRSARPARPPSA